MIVAADTPHGLLTRVKDIRYGLDGLDVVYEQSAAALPGALAGHEHFGFKDGVSQPGIRGRLSEHPTTTSPPATRQRRPEATTTCGHGCTANPVNSWSGQANSCLVSPDRTPRIFLIPRLRPIRQPTPSGPGRRPQQVRRNSSPGGISTWKQCGVQLNRRCLHVD